ncbi:MAG: hypothetical protein ACRDH5_14970, partial [bacterium]
MQLRTMLPILASASLLTAVAPTLAAQANVCLPNDLGCIDPSPVCDLVIALVGACPQDVCKDTPNVGRWCKQEDPCRQDDVSTQTAVDGQGRNDICARQGPAECIAIGIHVEVSPSLTSPVGATTDLSRSHAYASQLGPGNDFAHADAHQVQQSVSPFIASAGAVESSCAASVYADGTGARYSGAYGDADVTQFYLSLFPLGPPVFIYGNVLHEYGNSYANPWGSGGGNFANIADLVVCAAVCMPVAVPPAAPNTIIPLAPVGTLFVNEQWSSFD